MKAWANILFLLFVIFIGMFMTHLAIRHERLREQFRGGGGAAISRAGGTANSPLDGASLESFRGGHGKHGGHGGHGHLHGAPVHFGGGVADAPLVGAPIEGFRGVGGIGGSGGHGGGGLGGGHIGSGMGGGHAGHVGSGIRAPTHTGHYAFQRHEDHGRRGWHEPIDQPHHYPGGGATITRNWMGSGGGSGWFGYGWPFIWWGPAWYPEYAYICNKDSDCAVGKCGEAGFCVV
jgi:hypothetical protein